MVGLLTLSAANRLVEVLDGSDRSMARYGYDPEHRRLWKEQYRDRQGQPLAVPLRTLFLYGDEGLLAEAVQHLSMDGTTVTALDEPRVRTVYGWQPDSPWGTRPLFIRTPNSAGEAVFAYYHRDHLHTPVQASDKTGRVVWSAVYDAFGQATITTPAATAAAPTIDSALRLPGQYEDVETGLHYNFHRYYDVQTGRYLQSDPIGLEAGLNTYAYVGGNPLSYYDPYGLWAWGDPIDPGIVDAVTGFGDSASLGLTGLIRDGAGIDGGVNQCSDAYRNGGWATAALGGGRLVYAGLAKGYSVAASSGAAASAFRSQLRTAFGGGKSLRPPDLTRYPVDAALRGAAGRTNPWANSYGAGAAAAGTANGAGCGCPR